MAGLTVGGGSITICRFIKQSKRKPATVVNIAKIYRTNVIIVIWMKMTDCPIVIIIIKIGILKNDGR